MKTLIGNAVIGQSGGPTAAINTTLSGVIRGVIQQKDYIQTLYGMKNGIEGFLKEDFLNLTEFFDNEEKLRLLESTPAAALGSCRKCLPPVETDLAIYQKILSIFKKYNIRYFFYIGGNDSMDTVDKLNAFMQNEDYAVRIIGIPKTIDNDLAITDHTPGFGSAAKYIAVTIQEILRDCAVYQRPTVTIVEIMGRDAGWLTAASGLGLLSGAPVPDYIYLPERVFNVEKFAKDVRIALARHPNVVIAVSEGIHTEKGAYVCEWEGISATDVFGHKQLSGTAKALEFVVKREIGCKVRSVELNICQRCASHVASACDLKESLEIGKTAVYEACKGVSGVMMTLVRTSDNPYSFTISHTPTSSVANHIKYLPNEYINEEGNHITKECASFILPLVQGEAYPVFENGIPKFIIL